MESTITPPRNPAKGSVKPDTAGLAVESALSLQVEMHSEIKQGDGAAFHVHGHLNKSAGEIVLYQVFVNCLVGPADRVAPHALALHEIPLMRALQRLRGGSVEIVATWPDPKHVPQQRGLTKGQAMDLLQRLRGQNDPGMGQTSRGAYVHTSEDGTETNMFSKVYGGENGTKHRLFEAIRNSHQKWQEILRRARDEMRRVTAEDLEECVRECMPPDEMEDLDAIALDQVALNQATGDTPGVEGEGGLGEYLVEVHGVNDEVARAFASAITKAEGGKLSEELWATVPGLAKDLPEAVKKRNALTKKYGEFVKLSAG